MILEISGPVQDKKQTTYWQFVFCNFNDELVVQNLVPYISVITLRSSENDMFEGMYNGI